METIQVRWILVVSILCLVTKCQASRHRKRRQSKAVRIESKQWLQRVGELHQLRNQHLNRKLSKRKRNSRNRNVKKRFDNSQLLRKRNNNRSKKLRKATSFRKLLLVLPIERPQLLCNLKEKQMPPSLTALVAAAVGVTTAVAL